MISAFHSILLARCFQFFTLRGVCIKSIILPSLVGAFVCLPLVLRHDHILARPSRSQKTVHSLCFFPPQLPSRRSQILASPTGLIVSDDRRQTALTQLGIPISGLAIHPVVKSGLVLVVICGVSHSSWNRPTTTA
jgi:hypothetical protein